MNALREINTRKCIMTLTTHTNATKMMQFANYSPALVARTRFPPLDCRKIVKFSSSRKVESEKLYPSINSSPSSSSSSHLNKASQQIFSSQGFRDTCPSSLFMGSSGSSDHSKNRSSTPQTSQAMQTTFATTPAIPANNGTQPLQKPLKGILKNKTCVQKIEKPVKIVELYVLRGNVWSITRVREDEVDIRKKELKLDKTVKRTYSKPTQDKTFLHFQPF